MFDLEHVKDEAHLIGAMALVGISPRCSNSLSGRMVVLRKMTSHLTVGIVGNRMCEFSYKSITHIK